MNRKSIFFFMVFLVILSGFLFISHAAPSGKKPLNVVTSLPDYAEFVNAIGGERVDAQHIVHGVQDPHHVRPKPSFVRMVKKADMVVSTGLDLEMWLPTVIDKSARSSERHLHGLTGSLWGMNDKDLALVINHRKCSFVARRHCCRLIVPLWVM